jgi:hypothetical protein
MIRMSTMKTVFNTVHLRKVVIVFLALATLLLFHTSLVSALLSLGYLDAADSLSSNNPDVAEAQATRYRQLAVELAEAEQETEQAVKQEMMTSWQAQLKSREYWLQAINLRPTWPYYHLGALDIEVLLRDKVAIQQRIKHIIKLAPNERGLDEGLLTLAFFVWDWVEPTEQAWLLARLADVRYSTLKTVFSYAKQAGHHYDICAHLAWKKVKGLC